MAIRGFILANTGWTLEYMNGLPEEHLLFVYHWLNKAEEDRWERLGSHLGTLWDRKALERLGDAESGAKGKNPTIFVPLSLVMNPDLPDALLGKKANRPTTPSASGQNTGDGDGLNTDMSLPTGDEVVNMADLDKNEFFGLISNAGLATTKT